MVVHRLIEAEERERAVDLEAAEREEQDQRRLRPVPEPLESLVDVDLRPVMRPSACGC